MRHLEVFISAQRLLVPDFPRPRRRSSLSSSPLALARTVLPLTSASPRAGKDKEWENAFRHLSIFLLTRIPFQYRHERRQQSPDSGVPSDPQIFSAVITPYRSLGSTGFFVLMLCVSVFSFLAGMFFLMIGAWPGVPVSRL